MYPLLRQGDRLPTVAVLQILLNRNLTYGTYVGVDGRYGRNTRNAVEAFQSERGLGVDGIVGKDTWIALTQSEKLRVIDSVDLTDFKLIGEDDVAIRSAGGSPILNFGMCNGLKTVVDKILTKAPAGKVVLLRFHGHGGPGTMALTTGVGPMKGEFAGASAWAGSELSIETFELGSGTAFKLTFFYDLARLLGKLKPIFSRLGSVELHGCHVARGPYGRRLLKELARVWQVPVTAALGSQYGGGSTTFRYEGRTYTVCPGGRTMKTWIQSLPAPEIYGMSVSGY